MNVRLIAVTKPVIPEAQTAADLIAYVARVSNPDNQANTETAPRLLSYLARNAHWSPFEHASMTLEIETTRDIARQILRHRSFCFQEFSGRYAEMPDEPVYREARLQDHKNRQNSLPCVEDSLKQAWDHDQKHIFDLCHRIYKLALASGIAKEVARAVLPEGLTQSRLYMTGNVRSWLHYITIRTDPGTQKEHREVAQACADILFSNFPALKGLHSL